MERQYTTTEKDAILCDAFSKLLDRGITSRWSSSSRPFSELRDECTLLMTDSAFVSELQSYCQAHPVIHQSLEMFFTQIAMSARADWRNVPDKIRPINACGWFLGRWIPTFLIIDGPIGRFICKGDSPLFQRLKTEHYRYPFLTSARDFLNNDLFRRLRNGFGHWAFAWEVIDGESYVVAFDWESGTATAHLQQEEADAFHIIAFALIEVLSDVVIRRT